MAPAFDPTLTRYAIARATARRARMIYAGAKPLGVSASRQPCKIAVDEQRAGLIPFRICDPEERAMHIVKTG